MSTGPSASQARRLLFLNENIGGHRTVHINLRRAFAKRPEVNAVFVDVPPRGLARKLFDHPVPVLGPMDLDLQPLRGQLGASAVARRMLSGQGVSTSGTGFDALHVYTQNCALLSTAAISAYPTVVSTDSTNVLNAVRIPYRHPTRFTPFMVRANKHLERRVFDAATLLVASNSWSADSLLEYGVPAARIRTIRFGIEIPETAPRRLGATLPRITFIGHQLERKGGLLLLELHKRHLQGRAELVLVTTDAVEEHPGVVVRNDVRAGDGKLADILAGTTMMVFPSMIDQAPNVVLEAMAHGVPVIARRVAGIPEMLDDGSTGLLVDPDDNDGMLRAIESLLEDPGRAEEMGSAGRRRAEEMFNIERTADDLLQVLSESMDIYHRSGRIGR